MTKLELINSALIIAGAEPLETLASPAGKAGKVALAQFDISYKSLIRQHQWNFAMGREELEALPTPPTFEYERQYSLPDDYVRLFSLYDDYGARYSVEGDKLLTDMPSPVPLVYVKDTPDPVDWDSLFAEAVALNIASKVLFSLTQKMDLAAAADAKAERALSRAKWADSTENSGRLISAHQWVASRYGWSPQKDRFHRVTSPPEEPFPHFP